MRSMSRYLLAAAVVFAIAAGPVRAQEPESATEAPQPTATAPAATPTPNPMAPTAVPSGDTEAARASELPVVAPVEPAPVDVDAPPVADAVAPEPDAAPVEPAPAPEPAVVPDEPVHRPVARAVPKSKKPLENSAPKPEKSDREKALDAAAAQVRDAGNPPPSGGDVAGTAAAVPESAASEAAPADAAPMVPPLSASEETTAVRSDAAVETETGGSRGSGTWIVLGFLALGILFVAAMTVRRRKSEELSIFERTASVPASRRPPVPRHS